MLTPENCVQLCDTCPNRDTSEKAAPLGDLVSREVRYINTRLEFINDPLETPGVPVQEFRVQFVDTAGQKTESFFPGVQLQDIADCEKPVVAFRSGFMGRKKQYDCGAEAEKLQAFRKRIR